MNNKPRRREREQEQEAADQPLAILSRSLCSLSPSQSMWGWPTCFVPDTWVSLFFNCGHKGERKRQAEFGMNVFQRLFLCCGQIRQFHKLQFYMGRNKLNLQSPFQWYLRLHFFFFKLIWFSARALFGHFPQNCSQNEKLDISQGWATTQGRFRFVIVIDFLSFDQFKWHAFRRTLIAVKENYIVLEQFSHYMKVTFPLSSDGNTR